MPAGCQRIDRQHTAPMTDRTDAQSNPVEFFAPVAVILSLRWSWRHFRNRHAQQLAASVQFFFPEAIALEAVIADAEEAMRQNMEQKTTDEFLCGKGHRSLLAMVPIILVSEAHLTVFDVQQAMIGDGDAMGVATDVIQHLFWSGEGTLGIDHPFGLPYRFEIASKLAVIAKSLDRGEEVQLARIECLLQMLQKQTAEQERQHAYGQEEARFARNPARSIG